ncbi:MAG: putative hydro-lyase [Synergistales bacterium]|nr:putative hydro-lyase [Synergistales bacterium]
MIRTNEWTGPTAGISNGYTQANLVVVTKDLAYDLLLFCQRNPRPCPLLDVTEVGKPVPLMTAPGSDLRTDLPRYRIWKDGFLVDEPLDMTDYWRDDMVAFLLGCSFTFEGALLEAGIPVRHIEEGRNVPMYITNMECRRAGSLHGPMVVSMRPVPHSMVSRAVMITGRFPSVHGSPVHIGDPSVIGIREINDPDFGDRVTLKEGEVPVFWACGVTPQAALMKTRPPFAITHSPGHMFITDKRDLDYAIF